MHLYSHILSDGFLLNDTDRYRNYLRVDEAVYIRRYITSVARPRYVILEICCGIYSGLENEHVKVSVKRTYFNNLRCLYYKIISSILNDALNKIY